MISKVSAAQVFQAFSSIHQNCSTSQNPGAEYRWIWPSVLSTKNKRLLNSRNFRAHSSYDTRKDVTQQSWDLSTFHKGRYLAVPIPKICCSSFSSPHVGHRGLLLPCQSLYLQYPQQLIKKWDDEHWKRLNYLVRLKASKQFLKQLDSSITGYACGSFRTNHATNLTHFFPDQIFPIKKQSRISVMASYLLFELIIIYLSIFQMDWDFLSILFPSLPLALGTTSCWIPVFLRGIF